MHDVVPDVVAPAERRFSQVDVFSRTPLGGNPVAVVHDADGLDDERMAAFARWTNLSETTFLLPPTPDGARGGADYRLRIFTPGGELPFAGHPTLGSAHAWLEAGGAAADVEVRAFCPQYGVPEDPVTGSLNAGLGEWLAGRVLPTSYVAAQGTALGRSGRVHVRRDPDGTVRVGGDTLTTVSGTVVL